jgi:oligopeptide transport system ATP-binding protein
MDNPPLLVTEGLTKHFRISRGWLNRRAAIVRAVDDVSLHIEKGETLALVGESGSGKTTTAKLILRLIEPTSGRVVFNGQPVFALRGVELRRLRKELQVIFQDPRASLNPRKTIFEILRDPVLLHGMASK